MNDPSASDPQSEYITIGILADTHIPDRVTTLHPEILPIFQAAHVTHILHAGDISARWVLADLNQVAPVTAVRGNRDFLAGQLKLIEELEYHGVRLTLLHGHGGFWPYLRDKVQFFLAGYRLERYLKKLEQAGENSKAVIFGHTHFPVNRLHQGRLIFNPGSASFGFRAGDPPSIGLLHITPGGTVSGEILPLTGWKIQHRKWARG